MAFLWGSSTAQTEFDTLLEKTTSDLLPSSTPIDLSLSLQLADLIRSNSIPPSSSSKILLKRLQHSNPNVQLLTLGVLDVCIKNGGQPFLLQISDKEGSFVQYLESLTSSTSKSVNRDVREKTLEKLQEWASAFKQQGGGLRETKLVKLYEKLRNDNSIEFPTKDPIATAAMVDSLSAPEWKDSNYCTRCRTDFSTFNRKHHCRNCGQVFDQTCSSQTSSLPHYGITQSVRVCDTCFKMIKQGKGSQVARSTSTSSSSSSSKNKTTSSREDEDLRKAIQASLNDSSSSSHSHGPLRKQDTSTSSSGYNPSYLGDTKKKSEVGDGGGDQEDLDLAAAIAASLKDVQPPPTAPQAQQAVTYSEMFPPSSSNTTDYSSSMIATTPTSRPKLHLPNYDLSPNSLNRLTEFQQTFTNSHPGPTYLTLKEHELANESVRELKPRLEKSLKDTREKNLILKELEWKLSQAARIYGAGLTELNHNNHHKVYQQQQYAPPPQPQYSNIHNNNNPQYQYQPTLESSSVVQGQPLPNYSIPSSQPQPPILSQSQSQSQVEYSPNQTQYQEPPQQQQYQQPLPQQPQVEKVAGYYKPSSFPNVPKTNPISLESLPHVPNQEPRVAVVQEEKEEEDKIGELIEF
ncbi:hypothetical protein JCM3765_002356 [Sporobolomyces pararoseus]